MFIKKSRHQIKLLKYCPYLLTIFEESNKPMEEQISIDKNLSKEIQQSELLKQIKALIAGEENKIANLANICAVLKSHFNFWWVGFYILEKNTLVLGPFQGPVACTRIAMGKGVCGKAAEEKKTILVEDVDAFPGHIACSSASKSELVVPVIKDGLVKMVIDIDSEHLAYFDEQDKAFFESLANIIAEWA